MCACQKSYTSIIMTSITWAGPRCVQEAATFLGPQNRTQGRCELELRVRPLTLIALKLVNFKKASINDEFMRHEEHNPILGK